MKRRAHIKFIATDKVQITTLFSQKALKVSDDEYVDLVNLKKVPKRVFKNGKDYFNKDISNLKFYAHSQSSEGKINIAVYAETESSFCECLGDLSLEKKREGFFEITLKE